MNVSGTGMMQQTQMQTQAHKMDGTGQGQGMGQGQGAAKGGMNGMKDIMQNLSVEDRQTLSAQLQSLPEDQRSAMKEQLKSVDGTGLDSSSYLNQLLNVMNGGDTTDTRTDGFVTEVYA